MSNNKPIVVPASNGGDFELVPAGVYVARCFKIVDVGTQQVQFMNNPPKPTRQVYLYWEILEDADGNEVRMESGDPFFIFKQYTLSLNEKANLRKDLNAWRGQPLTEVEAKDFDISRLLDAYCLIQVVHRDANERTYVNVDTIMATTKHPAGVNPAVSFSIVDKEMEIYDELPDWLKLKIQDAAEWIDTGTTAPAKKEISGAINDDGKIEIEDLDKKAEPQGVSEKDLKNLPF